MNKFIRVAFTALNITICGSLFSQNIEPAYTPEQADFSYPVTNGTVRTAEKIGNTIFLGGDFNYIGPNTGYAVWTDTLGHPIKTFPRIEGTVNCALPDGAGGIYIGGDFTTVAGMHKSGFVHVDSTGKIVSKTPSINGFINCMEIRNEILYIGGGFTEIGGIKVSNLATIDINNDTVIPLNGGPEQPINSICFSENTLYAAMWGSSFSGPNIFKFNLLSNTSKVWYVDADNGINKLIYDNGRLYVGGAFSFINNKYYSGIIVLDTSGVVVNDFKLKLSSGSQIIDMLILNNKLYLSGRLKINSIDPEYNTIAADIYTGSITSWKKTIGGCDYFTFLGVQGSNILVSYNLTDVSIFTKAKLAAWDSVTAAQVSTPFETSNIVTCSVTLKNNVFYGGWFTSIGGEFHSCFTAFDVNTKKIKPWHIDSLGIVTLIYKSPKNLYVSCQKGLFTIDTAGKLNSVVIPGLKKLGAAKIKAYNGNLYMLGTFAISSGAYQSFVSFNENSKLLDDWRQTFISPTYISDFEIVDSTLFVVGTFDSIKSLPRKSIAAINLNSKKVSSWNPQVKGKNIQRITYGNEQLYINGSFESIDNQPRKNIGAIELRTSRVSKWLPPANLVFQDYDLYTFFKNNVLYVNDVFSPNPYANGLVALDGFTGQRLNWLNQRTVYSYSSGKYRSVYLYSYKVNILDDLMYSFSGPSSFFRQCYSGFCVFPIAKSLNHYVNGTLYRDSVSDCKKQLFEKGFHSFIVNSQPLNSFVISDDEGNYKMGVKDSVENVIQPIIPSRLANLYNPPCPLNYKITNPITAKDTNGFDFGYAPKALCPILEISISNPRRRRCFKGITSIKYSNEGTTDASAVFIHVKFPNYVVPLAADYPFTIDPLDSSIVFNIGNLKMQTSGNITITDSVLCKPGITGLTQCTKAWITPANDCYYALDSAFSKWDHSTLALSGKCLLGTGKIKFMIKNTGTGDMKSTSQYRIYSNDIIQSANYFQLNKNDSLIIEYVVAGGSTTRLETEQSLGFPGAKHPYCTIEACRTNILDPYSTGYVNTRPLDNDLETKTSCNTIIDSFDPNIKIVSPQGAGLYNVVEPNTLLSYHIDFQNTGSDTAYKVIIIDSLSADLDVSTFEAGIASHPYKLSVSGTGSPVLKFTFDGINLTDSITDEFHSHGFVEFKIAPKDTTPLETRINNFAEIYFDFNTPITTNIAWVTLDTTLLRKEQLITIVSQPVIEPRNCIGDSVCIHASFSGKKFKKFEWYKNDTLIKGANDSLITIKSLALSDTGSYFCKVSGYINAVTTNSVHLDCKPLPKPIIVTNNTMLASLLDYTSYQWLFNKLPLKGAMQKEFATTEDGNYNLMVVDSNGCSGVSETVEVISSGEISVLPNPANEYVIIEKRGEPLTRIRIYTSDGKEIRDILTEGKSKIQIPLINLSSGIYFVECYQEKQKSTFKSIKY